MSIATAQSGRDPEFDALSNDDIFAEAVDRLAIAYNAEKSNREDAKAAMEFREGDQWDASPATSQSETQPELTINLMDAFIDKVENNIREQRPRGKCHPVGDGADIDTARVINGIGRHVEVRSEAGVAYDQAAAHAITAGWGYFRMVPEYVSPKSFQVDLRILPIRNLFTVYIDPMAIMPAAQDMGWCLISMRMKLTEYRRLYGRRAEPMDFPTPEQAARLRDWHDKEEIRLAEYFRIREKPEMLYGLRDAQGKEFTAYAYELAEPATLEAAGVTIEGKRESVRRAVEWFKINGLEVLKREQLPGQWIPVFRVEGKANDIDGDVRRRGMAKAMMDPQRMVNYGEVAKIKRLGLAPKAPWVAAEGQTEGHPEWDTANTQPFSVLRYKPVVVAGSQGDILIPPPQRQQPAGIEAGFSEFVQGMRANLVTIAGQPNDTKMDPDGAIISGRALRQRQKMSDQSHYQYYDNQTLAIAQCWRVILDWIPHYYGEPGRIQRVIGEDSTPQMVTLNESVQEQGEGGAITKIKNDITVGMYDVVMDTGPGYETKREEGAETLIELVNSQSLGPRIAQVGPDLVLRSIDHPYMQELADRFAAQTPEGLKKVIAGLDERARSIVQMLAGENEQLKQALKNAQIEAKFGLDKAHIVAGTKVHDTLIRAETARHDTDVKADATIKAKTIEAAAKLVDSRAERGHEATMAEREITNAAIEAERGRQHTSAEAEMDRAAAVPPKPNGEAP